ncbi:MAG: glycosyltransferase family 4 protein [Armatimonadetes bacterium]|nr:glycosyltransferase family 4 protein [Armatimonadota bacterium]
MRPLVILHTESSSGWGGQEMRVISEVVGMLGRGHRVMLACRRGSEIARRAREKNIETYIMSLHGAFDIAGIRRVRAFLRRREVDIVNTHSSKDSWCAGFAARLSGDVKVVRTRHLSIPVKRSFETRLLYGSLHDTVVTAGETLRRHIIERVDLDPARVLSIPTGIDLDAFDPDRVTGSAFRDEIGADDTNPVIGSVGMLRHMKGHSYLIEAAASVLQEYPQARFVLAGDGPSAGALRERLSARASELGIADKFLMLGYREDIPEVMAGLDVFVHPSIGYEGVPQVVSQAMAMRRPVVATDVGAVCEQVVNGRTGILVEKANSRQLAQGILTVLKNPDTAARMGENGRRLVEDRYSLDTMLDETERLYARLLSED